MSTVPLATVDSPQAGKTLRRPSVVLCGSFRRDLSGLAAARNALVSAGCELLSPGSLEFVTDIGGFAVTAQEQAEDVATIEGRHIAALRRADFVWLHCPKGYVGASAALELGVAHSLDIPVFAAERPADATLAEFVTVVDSPDGPVALTGPRARTPAGPLRDLQEYYGRVAAERGFDQESAQDTMLLLTEEIGELARAVRKGIGLLRADAIVEDPAGELADVQLYLLHLANIVGVDLAAAVDAKEGHNHERYGLRAA